MKKTIIAAEEKGNMCRLLSSVLKSNDYTVIFAATGAQAVAYAASHVPDLLLIDTDIEDGKDAICRIRQWSDVPLIAMSENDREPEKIEVLDMGADDYITLPFGSGELLARIRAVLRRSRLSGDKGVQNKKAYRSGELEIDFEKYTVMLCGQKVHLTVNEFKIVELLARHAGKVLTYDYILKQIWGPFAREDNKTLRVNMSNLRRKIEKNPAEPEFLFTEPGVGYRIKETE